MPWSTLTQPQVRDLAWAVFSPSLIDPQQLSADLKCCGIELTAVRRQWLLELDSQPQRLSDYLARFSNRRLGLYFERLWHFFLAGDAAIELLQHNLPVREGRNTLGEYDCLYYCHQRQQTLHLELAVKFYLGVARRRQPGASPWEDWIGPGAEDRLDLKLRRMSEHQIRLSATAAGQAVLRQHHIAQPQLEVEVKGYLFFPSGESMRPPTCFSSTGNSCRWVCASDFYRELHQPSTSRYWSLLPRGEWLAPRRNRPLVASAALEEALTTRFSKRRQAVLLVALTPRGEETERLFITPDDWPAI